MKVRKEVKNLKYILRNILVPPSINECIGESIASFKVSLNLGPLKNFIKFSQDRCGTKIDNWGKANYS